jgi:co-chaperonin GroES (HSP10)
MSESWLDKAAEVAKRAVDIGEQPLPELECFLTPMPGRLIIQQDDVKRVSAIIYESKDKKPRPTTGKVIAVPIDGSLDNWMGKKILFAQFSGQALNFTGVHNWRVLQVEEILAVFNNEDDPHELDTNVV